MTVLIAGVGYLGVRLAELHLSQGEDVVGLENFYCTPRTGLSGLRKHPRFRLVQGSISSKSMLERAFALGPFSAVYLLAAQPSASVAETNPLYTEKTNLTGARMVLDAARAHASGPVIFGSSFHVYGAPLHGTISESCAYGAFADLSHLSKVYVEKLIEMYSRSRGLAGVSVRLGVVYGHGGAMKTEPSFMTVPNRFSAQAARGETLRVNPAATAPIGFIHLDDAVSALAAAVTVADRTCFANAVGESLSVRSVASLVRQAAKTRGLGTTIEPEQGDDDGASDDTFTVSSELSNAGWAPRHRMAQRIGEVIDHFRSESSRA